MWGKAVKKKKLKAGKTTNHHKLLKELADDIGSVGFLKDEEQMFIMPTIFPSFNRASQVGGLPGGCIIELHGPNMGGKTALGIGFLVSAQQQGHVVGIVDAEGSFKDPIWSEALGLDLDNTLYLVGESRQGRTFEQTAELVNKSIRNFTERQKKDKELRDKMFIFLVDSVTAMVPHEELYGEFGKANYGLQALLTSKWCKVLQSLILGTNISIIIINQERKKQNAGQYQKKWQSACGEALQYYAQFRIRVRKSSNITSGDILIAKEHTFLVEKSKVSSADEEGIFFTSTGKHPNIPLGWDMTRLYLHEGKLQGILNKPKNAKKVRCDFNEFTKEGLKEFKFLGMLRDKESGLQEWMLEEFGRKQHEIESASS